MRKSLLTLSFLFVCLLSFSQTANFPSFINYQAVLRDANGAVLTQTGTLRVKVYDSLNASVPSYIEDHDIIPNSVGMINLKIGNGTVVSSSIQSVAWSLGKVSYELYLNGINTPVGPKQPFACVPYAIYALNSGSGGGVIANGSINQTLYWNGSGWKATSNLNNDGTNIGIGKVAFNDEISFPTTTATAGALFTLDNQKKGYWVNNSTINPIWARPSGTATILQNNGDYVGIGTGSPEQKLDVNGYFRVGVGAGLSNEGWLIYSTVLGYSVLKASGGGFFEMRIEQSNNAPITFFTNGNEKVRITSIGNVGIGTITPTEKLQVLGNARVNNYFYNSPKTRFLNVGEADFQIALSANGNIEKTFGSGGVAIVSSSTGANALVAPVHLPQNATVTNITVWYVDNDVIGNMIFDFQKRANGAGSINSIISFTTSGNSATTLNNSMTPSEVIDNNSNTYFFRVFSGNWPSTNSQTMKIINARITYTITETD